MLQFKIINLLVYQNDTIATDIINSQSVKVLHQNIVLFAIFVFCIPLLAIFSVGENRLVE